MKTPKPRKPTDSPITVVFRPDSRNASRDFMILRSEADRLFREGEIWGDGTNGGFMPAKGRRSETDPVGFRRDYVYPRPAR